MEPIKELSAWPFIYAHDFLRYLIAAGLAYLIFWVWGRKWWRHKFIQHTFPKAKKLWYEFKYSMSTVLIFSWVGLGIYLSEKAGYTQIYENIADKGWFYFFFSLMLMILLHDTYFYWTHRWMHHKAFYKYVHKVHHMSTNPSPWAAYSFHPLEAVIEAGILPLIVFSFPVHPLAIFIFMIYMIARNVLGHLGFELFPKGFTRNKWFSWHTTATHHNLHHKFFHCNYGLYFSWWDRWMKTTHHEYDEKFDEVAGRKKLLLQKKAQKVLTITLMIIATGVAAQSPVGRWMTFDEATGAPLSIIAIDAASNGIEGKVAKIILQPHQGTDPICTRCEGAKKDQKVVGMTFLWGFEQSGNQWANGKILDPESGEIYNSKLWLENDNILKVRGYAGLFDLFYRTQTWKRRGNPIREGSPVGTWETIDDRTTHVKSVVKISKSNGKLVGKITKIFLLPAEGPDPICDQCPGTLKNQKIVGMRIMQDFRYHDGQWTGNIMDPANGITYNGTLWMEGTDHLNVRGYWGPFFRTQIWKRVK